MEIPLLWGRVHFQNLLQTGVKLTYSEISIGVEILYIFHTGLLDSVSTKYVSFNS